MNWQNKSDKELSERIGQFIRQTRINQKRKQEEVANTAGISRSTLSLLERGESVSLSTLLQVLRVLDALYVLDSFQAEEEISPIEYARLSKKERKRIR
ncbi:MAG: helix-turn-helix domain-containing protein [Bacteroidetes bacterium]|nr:helix-turn-helix domain-containing protein [Bacteroidota bacterium]